LLELAIASEPDTRFWKTEFAWLLNHPAIRPVQERADGGSPLTLSDIACQHAVRFPLVSGDPEWLRERSVAVVARRLAPFLAGGGHVGLDLSSVTRGETPAELRREQMHLVARGLQESLPQALSRYGLEPARLTLSALADHPGISRLVGLRRCSLLGRPRVILRLPDPLMLALRGGTAGESPAWPGDPTRYWQALTELAWRQPGIRLVLEHTTRPTCTLAGGERGNTVLPVSQFEVRADTAWLTLAIRLDALDHRSAQRQLRHELRRLLRSALRLADNLVDQIDWATPDLAQDALVNRRLAVHITGFGDLVDRWGLDPADFPTVDLVVRAVRLLRRLMLRESNALARERGAFPGLELRGLASSLTRSFGDAQASRLLRQAGLRHRHLLVLSPYSVFPRHTARRQLATYLHLLPALRSADTIAMHGEGVVRRLPLTVFQRLIQMTWAIGRNRP
jgi:hypothetical protein